jgi:dihydrofolate reductase
MRKVILGLAISLDGLIEGPEGEYDWCFTDQDYGMTDFLKTIDSIFYGRKSYEMMMRYVGEGENPFGGKTDYVFSNSLKKTGDYVLVNGDIPTEVNRIKKMVGKDIWLFGGASLTSALMAEGLVDELWLSVHPIVLGKGKALFSDLNQRVSLKLLDNKVYETGLVSMRYQVIL